jgi:hypothetical protein
MKRAAVILAALFSGEVLAEGHFVTGKQLYEWSQSREYRAIFAGYVAGVHDTVGAKQEYFCTPKTGVSAGARAQSVALWLAQNPGMRLEGEAFPLVVVALAEKWPCPKPAPKPPG